MSSTVVANVVIAGFSLTNRCLMYTSMLLSPTQAYLSMETNWPCGWGFIAFHIYQAHKLIIAAKTSQIHALCLLPEYLGTMHWVTYLCGAVSRNKFLFFVQALGSLALLLLDTTATGPCRKRRPEAGYGVYQFFFFGYRTLSKGWDTLFDLWLVFNLSLLPATIVVLIFVVLAKNWVELGRRALVVRGTCWLLLATWPFVLWTELIVKRNNIVSKTDMVSVYLFAVQVVTMIMPRTISHIRTFWPAFRTRLPYYITRRDTREPEIPMVIPLAAIHIVPPATTHTVPPATAYTVTPPTTPTVAPATVLPGAAQ